ncbi:4-amino-4-deoxychorismate lyase/para-aminobenzoate synthetase/4-amino-4-deoxychorismate lyase [Sphingobium sp. B11D3D]|nr:4-amino-4-deoxychorismate lyase/para-aminobenzoate synthetase/4-amino-4-deoxychorismate lyase [Sphingobium sp. B11D3D]
MIAKAHHFDLIETMAFDPEIGLPLLDLHIKRLERSARKLGFILDRHELRNELQAATFGFVEPMRVRILLGRIGTLSIEVRDMPPTSVGPVEVSIAPRLLPGDDLRVRHKTTDRRHYEAPLRQSGTFEVLLTDEAGYLTEGCFTNLFVQRGDTLLTPPLARGLLPGVLRQSLIDQSKATEADLRAEDLADGFLIGNAARGLMAARLVAPHG